ncbi:MAG: DUF1116 domain-containing protein [Acidimicrobiia bacterium]|nr:DUF1116 domain-containing protein [Acidimicrobiia bacterium]MYC43991.1 DUF1116 domain-containing protein [Acidimicrobiia bacterium]
MTGTAAGAALGALDETRVSAVGVRPAGEVTGAVGERRYLHAGPPLGGADIVGPLRGALIGALMLEGEADSPEEAARILDGGGLALASCHDNGGVGAMAGVVTPSIPVVVMETDQGSRAFSPLNEGLGKALRFGSYDPATLDRLRWMGAVAGPMLDAALEAVDGLDMVELWAEGLRRGDECHNRNVASSAAVLARLAPAIVAAAGRQDAVDVLSYIAANPHFFLAFSIAAAKAVSDVTHRSGDPGVVTAMSSNGRSLGIRVSGAGDRWFLTDSPAGEPKLFEGYEPADASPVLGDSFIAETVGLGAFALSASPAIVSFVGGDPLTASDTVEELRGICRGTSSRFLIPSEGFRGTPIGIDVHKVAATGIAPLANAGLAHREPGRGQVGACLLRLPLQPFAEAAAFLAG